MSFTNLISNYVKPVIDGVTIDDCELMARQKMTTMRFISAVSASNYKQRLVNDCRLAKSKSAYQSSVQATAQTTVQPTVQTTPQPSTQTASQPSVQTTPQSNTQTNIQQPITTGVSAIVEPDFANVKVYDLDTPSGTPSGASSSGGSVGSGGSVSEGNEETTPNALPMVSKPNYPLYAGIALSAIVLYKILK